MKVENWRVRGMSPVFQERSTVSILISALYELVMGAAAIVIVPL